MHFFDACLLLRERKEQEKERTGCQTFFRWWNDKFCFWRCSVVGRNTWWYTSCCFCRFSLLFLFCFLGFSSLAKINFAHTQSHTRLNVLLLFLLSVPIFASLSLLSCKFVCAEQTTQTGFALTHTLIRNSIHFQQTFMQICCWLAFVSFILQFSYCLFVVVRSYTEKEQEM